MKHNALRVTGITEDGIQIIGGCFKLLDTYGVPMPIIVSILAEHGYMVNWIDFCEDAVKHGWKLRAAVARLREAVGDTYDRHWVLGWEEKIKIYKRLREEQAS